VMARCPTAPLTDSALFTSARDHPARISRYFGSQSAMPTASSDFSSKSS
jgi:hypothetical protein